MFGVYVIRGMAEIGVTIVVGGLILGGTAGLLREIYKIRRGFAGPPETRQPPVRRALERLKSVRPR